MRQVRFEVFAQTPERSLLRFYGADGRLVGMRELESQAVEKFVAETESAYRAASPNLLDLGRRLYAWLDGTTERWLASARDEGPGLAVHVDGAARLRALPWELIADGGSFLCGVESSPLTPVRRVGTVARKLGVENRPLRLLFLASSPEEVRPVLEFEQEEARILEATRKQSIALEVEESGSLAGLRERVESAGAGYFDVLHLTGHADVKSDVPYFLAENEVGDLHQATVQEIAAAFVGNWPALVFLSGCKTGQAVQQGALPSLCEQLVAAGAPAVLGWALPVGDQSATLAAAELYHHLAAGKGIAEAVARARARLLRERSPYWHLLRLYADSTPLGELVTPAETKGRERLHQRRAEQVFLDAGAKREVCPRDRFVGRRRVLQRCLKVLRSLPGEEGSAEGVLLTGMGGLGKSSLAARLCERMSRHRKFVWVGRLDETQLLHGLGSQLADAAAQAVLNEPMALKLRLRKLLDEHLATERALFVFDDFEQNAEKAADGSLALDPEGRAVLEPPALGVLAALLAAVRETNSESRVIVTCRYDFPLPGPAQLHREHLETLRGADLDKKVRQLSAWAPKTAVPEELRKKAEHLSAGNPRLLERMNAVLADAATDAEALLRGLEDEAEDFRESVLLRKLLDLQTAACRGLLARLAVYGLPVDRAAVEAVADGRALEPHLTRAAALGLVESTPEPQGGGEQFFVSELLEPLLENELTAEERIEVCARAARQLYPVWWLGGKANEARALEIHRLAMLGEEKEIAVRVGDGVATRWINSARFREGELLCRETLRLGADFRILLTLARAEKVLGQSTEALAHYERALADCPPDAEETPRELRGVHAAILANLAELVAQQGDIPRALQLWNQSLEIEEAIGDVKGKATTLANMAWAAGQQGDATEKRRLNLEAARALAAVRAWLDLVTVLGNLGSSEDADAPGFLAQAFWLTFRVEVPLPATVGLAFAFSQKLGFEAEATPWVAAAAMFLSQNRGEHHPDRENLQQAAINLIRACAEARKISSEGFQEWIEAQGLFDPQRLFPTLNRHLEEIVGEDGWLFDRSLVAPVGSG